MRPNTRNLKSIRDALENNHFIHETINKNFDEKMEIIMNNKFTLSYLNVEKVN